MNRNRFWAIVVALFAVCLPLFLDSSAAGQTVLNVSLVRFEAFPTTTGVRLEWDVETEVGTAGYKIKRGESGNFIMLPGPDGNGDLFVLAEGGPISAFSYVVTDTSAVQGASYTYQLIEILTNSGEQLIDETTVTLILTPTNTPVTFSGDTGDSGSKNPNTAATATSAPVSATNAPAATSTSAPAATVSAPTPLPTNTTESAAQSAPAAGATEPPPPTATVPPAYPASEQETAVENEAAIAENNVLNSLVEVPVAEAQELDESAPAEAYPPPQVQVEESGGVEVAVVQAEEPVQIAAQPGAAGPIVIGGAGNSAANNAPAEATVPDIQETQEPESQSSSRILLWLAFLVALIIFSASVIGAILLYSRRRPMK